MVHRFEDRREELYRQGRPPPELRGRGVILVDDVLTTDSTMRAAVAAARIIVAVPAASVETFDEFQREVGEIICPLRVTGFRSVGQRYHRFEQTTDKEVKSLLDAANNDQRPMTQ